MTKRQQNHLRLHRSEHRVDDLNRYLHIFGAQQSGRTAHRQHQRQCVLRCAFGIHFRLNAHAFAIDRQTQGGQNSQQQHSYGNHRQIQLAEKEQQHQNNTKRHPIDDPAFFSGHQRCAPAAGLISASSLFSRSRAPIPSTRACGRSTIRCAHTSANIS